jgi:DNA (cytosine-5)-methyltransferase 1
MGMPAREKEWGDKARRFLKAELKRAGIGYKELAQRLQTHGMEETEAGIASKLARGTFAVSFFLACLSVLELEGVRLEDL